MNLKRWLALLGLCAMVPAQATVSLLGTRLILGAGNEVSIEAHNRSDQEVLLQAWLALPGSSDEAAVASDRPLPFVVTPALLRLPGLGRQQLRVLYQGQGMPTDRESLVHLYVLEIPQRSEAGQQLSIAVRQRINVFHRPPGLPGDPALAPVALRWSLSHEVAGRARLQVSNPTAFHVALLDLQLDGRAVRDYLLLAPGQRFDWPTPPHVARQLTFKALTDYGGRRDYCAQPTGQAAFSARLLDTPLMAGDC
ncbi:pili assembly chaperone [Pseudomonas sp. StFLB209]|uniref:fimbrial biogenesis chaperone n=1 Tax=Pseudomonas sp. StFLB209 TaxID=1028989 RepID=UPI0004F8197D|nr:molecular chaperone [Pseudomonas sp. StFLB209]BAP41356.1 pili assembly chaperone [Pseudomonas sp. StFLB209]